MKQTEPNTIIHVEGGGAIVMWRQRHVLFGDLEYLLGVSKPRYPLPAIVDHSLDWNILFASFNKLQWIQLFDYFIDIN